MTNTPLAEGEMTKGACTNCKRDYEKELRDFGLCCICERDLTATRAFGAAWLDNVHSLHARLEAAERENKRLTLRAAQSEAGLGKEVKQVALLQTRANELLDDAEAKLSTAQARISELEAALTVLLKRCDHRPQYADGSFGPPTLSRQGAAERDAVDLARAALQQETKP